MTKCGHETKTGKPCQQSIEFFPCQYHDRTEFARGVKALTTGQAVLCVLCPACGRYYPILMGAHTCDRVSVGVGG